jgi:hypothetical protein
MPWGGLNPALTAWRTGIQQRFPHRGTASDGGYADALHGSASQHQADADGTVDAYDMDVNLLGSDDPAGSATERRLIEALKLDFEADGRGQLWIHQRELANRDVGTWQERPYDGANPHDRHVHWQSRQATERDDRPWKFTHTDALLRELANPRKVPHVKITTSFPQLQQGDRDDRLDGYNVIVRIQAIVGADRDGAWGPATTAKIAEWCQIDKSKATKLTEDIFRKVFGLPVAS